MKWTIMAAAAATLVVTSAAQAGVAEDLIAAINKCASYADDGMRHSCYDGLPAKVKALAPAQTQAVPVSPSAAPFATATVPADPKAVVANTASDPEPAGQLNATVESFTFDYGLFVVTLDNGQVWRQVAALGDIVHLSKDAKNTVAIWRNAFGEYVMKIDGYRTKYHVRRIN